MRSGTRATLARVAHLLIVQPLHPIYIGIGMQVNINMKMQNGQNLTVSVAQRHAMFKWRVKPSGKSNHLLNFLRRLNFTPSRESLGKGAELS